MTELYHTQNADRAVGPADYRRFGDKLLITSIFVTIQGEGPFAGFPAAFVRLAGCNRGAKDPLSQCGFCDTRFHFDAGREMYVADIVKEVASSFPATQSPCLVVITGGEPMMQDNVWFLVKALIEYDYIVQMESNGDRLAPFFVSDPVPVKDMILVVSPKARKTGYPKLRQEVLDRADVFKFLLDARPQSYYNTVPASFIEEHGDKITVSPITVYKRPVTSGEVPSIFDSSLIDAELTKANARYAAQYAISNGLIVSLQTHLWLGME